MKTKCKFCGRKLTDIEQLNFGDICPKCENEQYDNWIDAVNDKMEDY